MLKLVVLVAAIAVLVSCDVSRHVSISSSFTADELPKVIEGVQRWGPVTLTIATNPRDEHNIWRFPGDYNEAAVCRVMAGTLYLGLTIGRAETCIAADSINADPFPGYDGWIGVAAHETGHLLGIDHHTPDKGTVMFASYGGGADKLTAEDWAALEGR